MKKAIVICCQYNGRIGNATEPNEYGNVMFYPIEEIHPYKVCLKVSDVKFIEGGDAM